MTAPLSQLRELLAAGYPDRRVGGYVLLFLLVLAGAGFGTLAMNGADGPSAQPPTETLPVVEATPVSEPPQPTAVDTPPGGTARDPAGGSDRTATVTRTATTPVATGTERPEPQTESTVGSDSGGGTANPVEQEIIGNSVFFDLSSVTPGSGGQERIVIENAGTEPATLDVDTIAVTDFENSLLPAERAVGDDATTGELSTTLRVRLAATYSDGRAEYLFGSPTGYVTLADIDGAAATTITEIDGGDRVTVRMEWKLPSSAGNRHQSDSVEFDVAFTLRTE